MNLVPEIGTTNQFDHSVSFPLILTKDNKMTKLIRITLFLDAKLNNFLFEGLVVIKILILVYCIHLIKIMIS